MCVILLMRHKTITHSLKHKLTHLLRHALRTSLLSYPRLFVIAISILTKNSTNSLPPSVVFSSTDSPPTQTTPMQSNTILIVAVAVPCAIVLIVAAIVLIFTLKRKRGTSKYPKREDPYADVQDNTCTRSNSLKFMNMGEYAETVDSKKIFEDQNVMQRNESVESVESKMFDDKNASSEIQDKIPSAGYMSIEDVEKERAEKRPAPQTKAQVSKTPDVVVYAKVNKNTP